MQGKRVIVVDVDGVLFHSPIIDLARVLAIATPRTLLRIAVKLHRYGQVRRVIQRLLRLNPRAIAYVRLRAKQGYVIAYCTGRTTYSILELMEILARHRLPVYAIVSRTGEISNLTLKLYAIALLRKKGLIVSEVHEDASAIYKVLSNTTRVCLWRRGKLLTITS